MSVLALREGAIGLQQTILTPQGSIDALLATSGDSLLWLPNGGGDVATWTEVDAAIQSTQRPMTVTIGGPEDGPYFIPFRTAPWNLREATFIQRRVVPKTPIVVDADAQLDNLHALFNCALRVTASTRPALTFSDAIPGQAVVLLMRLGAEIQNNGDVAAIEVVAGTPFIFGNFDQSNGFVTGSDAPLIHVASNGLAAIFAGFVSPQCSIPPNMVTGDVDSSFLIVADGSLPRPYAAFPGITTLNVPVGGNGGSGPSSLRPVASLWAIPDWCMYGDETLGKPIWFRTSSGLWVDATGTPV